MMRRPRRYGPRSRGVGLATFLSIAALCPAWSPAAGPLPSVVVVPVVVRNVAPTHQYIGHVIAIQSVKLVARITAFIQKVVVTQGADVKAGAVLFRLQTAQYRAALQTAEAGLASAQAAYANAELAYQRGLRLSKRGFEAQANLDSALATRNQDKAKILSAEASIAQARLNLSYCTIKAPISGRIGAVSLTQGNLVTPSTGTLATINQLNPIRVVFSVSDSRLVTAEQRNQPSHHKLGAGVKVHLVLSNGTRYAQTGKIVFLDNAVSSQTGTVSVYADFANPKDLLLPGSYVTVTTKPAKPENVPLVPVEAVQTDKNGNFVLTVGPNKQVARRPIKLGRQLGQDYIVESGVSGGESVIVEGIQKVKNGQKVNPTTQCPSNHQKTATN